MQAQVLDEEPGPGSMDHVEGHDSHHHEQNNGQNHDGPHEVRSLDMHHERVVKEGGRVQQVKLHDNGRIVAFFLN